VKRQRDPSNQSNPVVANRHLDVILCNHGITMTQARHSRTRSWWGLVAVGSVRDRPSCISSETSDQTDRNQIPNASATRMKAALIRHRG